jgi:hypothetical protein
MRVQRSAARCRCTCASVMASRALVASSSSTMAGGLPMGLGRQPALLQISMPPGVQRYLNAFAHGIRSQLQEQAKPMPTGKVFASGFVLKKLQRQSSPARHYSPCDKR